MRIFLGEKDAIDYSKPEKYAFLNWRFEYGGKSSTINQRIEVIQDNYQLGGAYLGSALVNLFALSNYNETCEADIMIFPVLFSIWHGIELWLKSSLETLRIIDNGERIDKNHDIYNYFELIKYELEKEKYDYISIEALTDVGIVIEEFKRVNAEFDFARYSFGKNDNPQFYNATFENDCQWQKTIDDERQKDVPNVSIEIRVLLDVVKTIYNSFGIFVQYLISVLAGEMELSDECYKEYTDDYRKHYYHNFADDSLESIMKDLY